MGFQRRLRDFWGDALDSFYAVYVCSQELGGTFDLIHRETAKTDTRLHVLIGLHARACRIANEVHHLLTGGFPGGALARTRTLHELAVTATVIKEYGTPDQHPDLAQRFLQHQAVRAFKDAEEFNKHAERMGFKEFTRHEMREMQKRSDKAVDKYGNGFKGQFGWAAKLDGFAGDGGFKGLANVAGMSHGQPQYNFACYEVHAGMKGLDLNTRERGGVLYSMTGSTNAALSDAGHSALISLHQVLVSLLLSVDALAADLVNLRTVEAMVARTGQLFADAESAVAEAERLLERTEMRD